MSGKEKLLSYEFRNLMLKEFRDDDSNYFHNGIILSTLDISRHAFAFGFNFIPLEIVVLTYMPRNFPSSM